jgi:hypothetical protein
MTKIENGPISDEQERQDRDVIILSSEDVDGDHNHDDEVEEEQGVSLIANISNEDSSHDGDTPTPSFTCADLWWIAGLTLAFEALTCFFRFGLHLQSTRDTARLARYTFGLRIHHGYLGIALLLTMTTRCCWWRWAHRRLPFFVRVWCFRVGWSLILSDASHHFLVLWPVTGSPQFDIFYPDDNKGGDGDRL